MSEDYIRQKFAGETTGTLIAHRLISEFGLEEGCLDSTIGELFPQWVANPTEGGNSNYSGVYANLKEHASGTVLQRIEAKYGENQMNIKVELKPRKGPSHPVNGHWDTMLYLVVKISNTNDSGDFFVNENPTGLYYGYQNPPLEVFIRSIANAYDGMMERIGEKIDVNVPIWIKDINRVL